MAQIKWYQGLAIVGNVVVGRVYQIPSTGEIPHGSIRPASPWRALGMRTRWDEVDLGEHKSREEAVLAIREWSKPEPEPQKAEAGLMKVPCSVHYRFRKDCIECIKLNVEND